jgi:hypothetical protein
MAPPSSTYRHCFRSARALPDSCLLASSTPVSDRSTVLSHKRSDESVQRLER